ncbi:hypothetical protein NOS3756_55710 (plasmid) [Nostoc sp. NIES-3756]|uniref:hypothetical protein n=1 Tax=Nostoc sp. NIES-3756 TaxID=1751286 RepID=UPI00071EED4F|nr:hypothetical protein [Nostoc sp. NIES-3756]BAT56559.1 hypothetical protein NOS3756_55710 [Nostoc sp. NIES-3756]
MKKQGQLTVKKQFLNSEFCRIFKSWFDIAKDYRRKYQVAWNAMTNQFEHFSASPIHSKANTA